MLWSLTAPVNTADVFLYHCESDSFDAVRTETQLIGIFSVLLD